MTVDPELFDDEGEPITQLYGCGCDVDFACNVAQCLMEQELTREHYRGLYLAGKLGPDPDDEYERFRDRLLDRADYLHDLAREEAWGK